MGEEHELKGLGSLRKKTPFYRTSRIQPLCVQVVHKRYYRWAVLPLSTVKTAQQERKHEFLVQSGTTSLAELQLVVSLSLGFFDRAKR